MLPQVGEKEEEEEGEDEGFLEVSVIASSLSQSVVLSLWFFFSIFLSA